MSEEKKIAVIIHSVRGGKDPDEFWHVVTEDLADGLNQDDPWQDLPELESANDPRIIEGYVGSYAGAVKAAEMHGFEVDPEVFEAETY